MRLIGEPGVGKSVCALQAARILAARGWRVVRLLDPAVSTLDLPAGDDLSLYVIGDAHLTPAGVLRAAEESATARSYLLTTHNALGYRDAGPGSIRLDGKRAVRVIAAGLRADLASTLEVVRRADDHVGDRPMDVPLEARLDHAEAVSDRPWQFCFILGGGWRRARQAADTSRSVGADIVLAGAAVRQIASRDARCGRRDLLSLTATIGLDRARAEAALDWLVQQRLLLGRDDLRCPHQRFAAVVLGRVLEDQDATGREIIGQLLHAALNDPDLPLAGQQSLLRELRLTGDFGRWASLVDGRRLCRLVDRCWSASAGEDRAFAMLTLVELSGYLPDWPRTRMCAPFRPPVLAEQCASAAQGPCGAAPCRAATPICVDPTRAEGDPPC